MRDDEKLLGFSSDVWSVSTANSRNATSLALLDALLDDVFDDLMNALGLNAKHVLGERCVENLVARVLLSNARLGGIVERRFDVTCNLGYVQRAGGSSIGAEEEALAVCLGALR